jgi:predicted ATPase/DNA-binding XRE family transcriptional regulator
MDDIPSFGAWLKRRRKALDLTQEALAQRVGCSVVSIRKFESDTQRPSRQLAALLAARLQLPPEEHASFVRYARGGLDAVPPTLSTLIATIPARPAKAATSAPAQSNLPTRLSSFIGREAEQRELRALLQRPEVRLLSLTGPGGAGKTSLAIRVSASLAAEYADGIWFVDLAPVSDPARVAPTILQALGIPERAQVPIATLLQEWLRSKHLLLILDNFEQVLDAAPLVSAILSVAPEVQALVTSRAPLRLQGEHEYAVVALELPPRQLTTTHAHAREQIARTDDLTRYAACALFVERAQAVVPSFAPSQASATAVAEICIRLDGLPLAIELAAARVRLFPPAALRDRLLDGRTLTTLAGKMRDVPSRQQTIRATIAWSYNLLNPAEQALFMRLGVFVGGWTIPAAEAICADIDLDVVEGLTTLVEHNLVRAIASDDEPRFSMLETLREYTLERLAEAGLEETLRERHAAYYLSLTEQMTRAFNTADERLWLDRVDREPDNIRAVYQWAIARGRREFAKRFNWSLFAFYSARGGSVIEIRYWIKAALALPIDEPSAPFSPITEAQALNLAGYAAGVQADYADAEVCFGEELRIYTMLDNQAGIASAYKGLGFIAMQRGDLVRAKQDMEQALSLSRAANDRLRAAWALSDLGRLALARGDLQQAQVYLEEALPECYELGDLRDAFVALLRLGRVLRAQEDLHSAHIKYDQAFQLQQQMHYTYPVDEGLDGVAGVAAAAGDPIRAARLFGAAHAIRRESGYDVDPDLKIRYARDLALARSQLSPEHWQAAWDAGMAMSLDQAVKFALAE